LLYVLCLCIGIGINGNRSYSESATGVNNPAGNFPPIGD